MSAREHEDFRSPIHVLTNGEHHGVAQDYLVDTPLEITPRDDRWLLSKDRKWEEIDVILEGRLMQLQEFNEKEFGVGMNEARIVGYAQMFDEYSSLSDSYNNQTNNVIATYEKAKAEIKGRRIGEGQKRKLVSQKRSEIDPKIKELDEHSSEATRVGDLILKKLFLDMFSVDSNNTPTGKPMVTENIEEILDDARLLVKNNPNVLGQNFAKKDSVGNLINQLGLRVDEYADSDLLRRFNYSYSNGLVSKRADAEVIVSTAKTFMTGTTLKKEDPNAWRNVELCTALFLAMGKKATTESKISNSENGYPYTTYIHNVLTAAFHSGDPLTIKATIVWLDLSMKKFVNNQDFAEETKRLAANYEENLDILAKGFVGSASLRLPNRDFVVSSSDDVSKVPHEIKQFIVSDENRLLRVYEILGASLTKSGQKAAEILGKNLIKAKNGYPYGVEKLRIDNLVPNLETVPFLESCGIEISLSDILIGGDAFIDWMAINEFKNSSVKHKGESVGNPEVFLGLYQKRLGKKMMVYQGYSQDSMPGHEYFVQQHRENSVYAREISQKAMWFVSPRGDKFMGLQDERLKGALVDYVTFYTDPNFPREHKIILKYSKFEEPYELWLDSDQNLLGAEHSKITGDPRMISEVKNMLLERLYFITSGLLSEKSGKFKPREGDGEEVVFRRAHYMVLESTANRTITMTSPGVEEHAAAIRSTYGIDIKEETKRRRILGVIKPYQHLTFSKEVATGNRLSFAPNEIVFDASLIKLDL